MNDINKDTINHIIGILITKDKYLFIDKMIIAEIVKDTINLINQIKDQLK